MLIQNVNNVIVQQRRIGFNKSEIFRRRFLILGNYLFEPLALRRRFTSLQIVHFMNCLTSISISRKSDVQGKKTSVKIEKKNTKEEILESVI